MASDKKKRKKLAQDRKLFDPSPTSSSLLPKPSKDGDRRRRVFGAMVRKAIQRKQAVRDWNLDADPLSILESSSEEPESPRHS